MNANPSGGLAIAGIVIAVGILSVVYYVFQVIANWKIFTKAGEKGWKSLIPFYNLITQYKLTWKPIMAVPVFLLLAFYSVVSQATANNPDVTVLSVLGSLAGIVGGILNIIGLNKLSKSFGKGAGFTLGLWLLAPIFCIILGFGKAQYIGNTTKK